MRIGVLADLHWSAAPRAAAGWHAPYDFDGLAARCAATVAALAAHGCELIALAGDLTHDGDEASCAAALDCVLGAAPIPVAVVEGNHDVRRDPALLARREDVHDGWRRSHAIARERLVALHAIGLRPDGGWRAEGGTRVEAGGLATVLVGHYPLIPHADRLAAAGLPFPGELAERELLLELAAAPGGATIALGGHLHVRDATAHGSVLQICVPSLAEPPHEAAVVDVDPLARTVRCTRVRSVGAAPDRGAEPWLLAPADEHWSFAEGSWTRLEVAVPVEAVLTEA